jgi:molecular chaperone Hsp33
MGTDEIKDMLVQDGQAELRCHFCSKTYLFDADDLIKLIQEIQADEAEA